MQLTPPSRIQQGDNIFYTDNYKKISLYSQVAVKAIQSLGLTPFWYLGVGLDAKESNLNTEIREDFYKSKVVVLVLGKGEDWRSLEDNWAMPELEIAISMGIKCLIYITAEITPEEINLLNLPLASINTVNDEDHFKTLFEQELSQLMTPA